MNEPKVTIIISEWSVYQYHNCLCTVVVDYGKHVVFCWESSNPTGQGRNCTITVKFDIPKSRQVSSSLYITGHWMSAHDILIGSILLAASVYYVLLVSPSSSLEFLGKLCSNDC